MLKYLIFKFDSSSYSAQDLEIKLSILQFYNYHNINNELNLLSFKIENSCFFSIHCSLTHSCVAGS